MCRTRVKNTLLSIIFLYFIVSFGLHHDLFGWLDNLIWLHPILWVLIIVPQNAVTWLARKTTRAGERQRALSGGRPALL